MNGMETINQKRLKMSSKYETNKLRGKLQVLRRYEIRIHPPIRSEPYQTIPNDVWFALVFLSKLRRSVRLLKHKTRMSNPA